MTGEHGCHVSYCRLCDSTHPSGLHTSHTVRQMANELRWSERGSLPHDELSDECWCRVVVLRRVEAEGAPCGLWVECEQPCFGDHPHVICHRYPKGTPGACYFLEDA